ncbi:hypothetical protein [Sporomusa acidovorans]|uniref:Uncharacterized protein n=1 Tax=Sporomusa acidovorans (strain ATCC 49682 / DSM 3132 / Mol) TaxID=1123286 RepID=A0ABZ3J552_SPOA4|nr:hypothetical protein [Sporomusa acidovorans]OZC15591.1 hypothetical protein SPACI_48950 [Sporomusa acidovorans DSM 3132]SDE19068.1 hypothetical protein SAMN04488499_1009124 [Sporomusa acidovorans]
MPKKEVNWVVGGVALVLTLIVLFSGQFLWNKYAVTNPISKMFQNVNGVESVTVGQQSNNNEKIKIYVKLNHVSNLQTLYSEIVDGLKQMDNGKKYDIVIQDNRTPELEEFYYQIQYYIQEAIFTGNFASMAESVGIKANNDGVTEKIYIDADNIYLQLVKGNAAMYMIIPRNNNGQGGK